MVRTWAAGTDPRDPLSWFRVRVRHPPAGGDQVEVFWATISNRTYTLLASTNLVEPVAWTTLGDRAGGGALMVVTNLTGDANRRYFRIRLTP